MPMSKDNTFKRFWNLLRSCNIIILKRKGRSIQDTVNIPQKACPQKKSARDVFDAVSMQCVKNCLHEYFNGYG